MIPLQILIVADDPLVRAGLSTLLDEQPDCAISGEIGSEVLYSESSPSYDRPIPDVILWDLGWEQNSPLPDPLDTSVPIVALLDDKLMAAEAWNAGIRAMVRRNTRADKLLDVARAAWQGYVVVDPQLTPNLPLMRYSAESTLQEDLTPRETEVLQLLAEGLTNKGIAQRLGISDHTVKFHVNAIMSKLEAQSRTEAVVHATRLGLILL